MKKLMLLAALALSSQTLAAGVVYEYAVFDNGSASDDTITWNAPEGIVSGKKYAELFAQLKCPAGNAGFAGFLNCVGSQGWKIDSVRYSGEIDKYIIFSRIKN